MAGDLSLAMVLRADASQAKAEFAATGKAVSDFRSVAQGLPPALSGIATAEQAAATAAEGLQAALGGLNRDVAAQVSGMIEADRAAAAWQVELEGVRASINPMFAMLQGLREGLTAVASAEELGAISAREAAVMHDQLARSMIELDAKAAAAGLSLDGLSARGRATATATQQLIARQTGLTAATENAAASALRHGAALDDLRARYNPLFAASRQYEVELRNIAEAERLCAISAAEAANARQRAAMAMAPMPGQLRGIGTESRAATAHMANLGFQLNDIGMMMSLGQSPFMLMMQQGPQVVQVFDQMRASGQAIGPALKSAFLGLLNPVSILTLGVIGLGAAGVQWLSGLGGEVETLDDRLARMTEAVDRMTTSQRAARQTGADLAQTYGVLATEAKRALDAMAESDRLRAMGALRGGATGLATQFGGFEEIAGDAASLIGSGYEETLRNLRREFDLTANGAVEVAQRLRNLSQAEGPEEIARAANNAREAFILAGGAADSEFAAGLASLAQKAAAAVGALESASAAADRMIASMAQETELAEAILRYGEQSAEAQAVRVSQAETALEIAMAERGIAAQSAEADRVRAEFMRQLVVEEQSRQAALSRSFEIKRRELEQEAQLAELTRIYGEESLQVQYAKVAAAREAYEAGLAAAGVAGEQANALMAAWDNARGIAAVNMAAGIGAATDEAWLLSAALGVSLQKAMAIGRQNAINAAKPKVAFGLPGMADPVIGGASGLTFGPNPGQPGRPGTRIEIEAPGVGRVGGGRGRGASDADRERKAVADLIEKLREEQDVLRETDPIRAELLRYRREMAAATPEEARQIEELIRLRHEEASAVEALKFASESAGSALIDALMGGANAGERLIETLKRAALEALILGQGPLAGLFGTAGSSIFDAFSFNPFDRELADGGRVTGPGGPRDDVIPAMLSNGEYVINAAATAKHLPLIEAINSGRPLKLADGGMVGMAAPSSWARAGAAAPASGASGEAAQGAGIYLDLRGVQGEDEIEKRVVRAMRPMLELFKRHQLPAEIKKVRQDPRRKG